MNKESSISWGLEGKMTNKYQLGLIKKVDNFANMGLRNIKRPEYMRWAAKELKELFPDCNPYLTAHIRGPMDYSPLSLRLFAERPSVNGHPDWNVNKDIVVIEWEMERRCEWDYERQLTKGLEAEIIKSPDDWYCKETRLYKLKVELLDSLEFGQW